MKLYIHNESVSPCSFVVDESYFGRFAPGEEHQCALESGFIEVPAPAGEKPDDGAWYLATLVDGAWVTEWVSRSSAILEAESQLARRERNARLAATDWTQCKDIPESVSQAWAVYRQALRDLPGQQGFPSSIQWPERPA